MILNAVKFIASCGVFKALNLVILYIKIYKMTTNGHDYSINHHLNDINKDNTTKENINEIDTFICNYCCKMFYMNRLDFINHQNDCKDADHSDSPITTRWMKKIPLEKQREDFCFNEKEAHREFIQKKKAEAELKKVVKKRISLYKDRPPTR